VSRPSIWAILGVEATTDTTIIRRAYAGRLKQTNPEDDPEGFQALRAAYEQALRQASGRPSRPAPMVVDEPPKPRSRTAPGTLRPTPDGSEAEADSDAEPDAVRQLSRERDEHRTAFKRLESLVRSPPTDPQPLIDALRAVLASPAMDLVSVYDDTENRLAQLIVRGIPRADVLIEPTIAHFQWDSGRRRDVARNQQAVLARRADLDVLAKLRRTGSPHHRAFRDLTTKPNRWRRLLRQQTPGAPRAVAKLLNQLRMEHPSLLPELDPEALADWDAYLGKPRYAPARLLMFVAVPAAVLALILGLALARDAPVGVAFMESAGIFLAELLLTSALAAAWLVTITRPRARWREEWRWGAALWIRLGWAPALLATLAAAALIPPSAVATVLVLVVSAVGLAWAFITGEADQRSGVNISWHVRALLSHIYLALFWVFMLSEMEPLAWGQAGVTLAITIAGFVVGGDSLYNQWRVGLSASARRIGLYAIGAAAAITPFLLWWAAPDRTFVPIQAALVAVLVLLTKVVTSRLTGTAYLVRDRGMRFGWVAWIMFAGIANEAHQGNTVLLFGALWLMAGASVGIVGELVELRPVRRTQ
jgi:hypothetical protein